MSQPDNQDAFAALQTALNTDKPVVIYSTENQYKKLKEYFSGCKSTVVNANKIEDREKYNGLVNAIRIKSYSYLRERVYAANRAYIRRVLRQFYKPYKESDIWPLFLARIGNEVVLNVASINSSEYPFLK